jgi:hypothetical protein
LGPELVEVPGASHFHRCDTASRIVASRDGPECSTFPTDRPLSPQLVSRVQVARNLRHACVSEHQLNDPDVDDPPQEAACALLTQVVSGQADSMQLGAVDASVLFRPLRVVPVGDEQQGLPGGLKLPRAALGSVGSRWCASMRMAMWAEPQYRARVVFYGDNPIRRRMS